MAQANLRSTRKASHVLGLFSLLLLVQKGIAFEFKVGGPNGWTVPADPNSNSHNQWAEKNRFQTGDSLCKLIILLTSASISHQLQRYSCAATYLSSASSILHSANTTNEILSVTYYFLLQCSSTLETKTLCFT